MALLGGNLGAVAGVKGQVQARGVERRRAIIDAAIQLFAQNGYRGTAIADIAERAGVTNGGLLHHFGTKEALLVEVIRQRDQDALDAIDRLDHDTVAEHFAAWVGVAAWNETRAPYVGLHAMLLSESIEPDHPAYTYFAGRNVWIRELLSAALQKGVDSGELRPDVDVDTKAREIQAFVEGAALMWLREPVPGGLIRLYRELLRGPAGRVAPPLRCAPSAGPTDSQWTGNRVLISLTGRSALSAFTDPDPSLTIPQLLTR